LLKRSEVCVAGLLLFCAVGGNAQSVTNPPPGNGGHNTTPRGVAESVPPVEQIADAIVVYTPMMHHALDRIASTERVLSVRADKLEKGKEVPKTVVHKANVMIAPLEAGVPVRMYLKRFEDRDAYFPIAIYPLSLGGK
jgi:hypothetical protein